MHRGIPFVLLTVALGLSMAFPAQGGQDDEAALVQQAKRLLRSGNLEEKRQGVEQLVVLDSGLSVQPLEDAVRRSAKSMNRLAPRMDELDDKWQEAYWHLEDCRAKYPRLIGEATRAYDAVNRERDSLASTIRGHLELVLLCGEGLRSFRSSGAVARIENGARDENNALVRQMYIEALGAGAHPDRLPVLLELLKDTDARARSLAVRQLRGYRPRESFLAALDPVLQDKTWSVRTGAWEVVARMPREVAVPRLVDAMSREKGLHASRLDDLLSSLTGFSFEGDPDLWMRWWKEHEAAVLDGSFQPRTERPHEDDAARKTAARFFDIPLVSENVLFVLDFSSSMKADMDVPDKRINETRGDSLKPTRHGYAIAGTLLALKGMPEGARFNVAIYHEDVKWMSRRGVIVSRSTVRRAEQWLKDQAMGRLTNLFDGLRQSFGDLHGTSGALRMQYLPDTVIFLTDGVATNGRFQEAEPLIDLVELWNACAGVAVHTVGMGSGHDSWLLKEVAKATDGFYLDLESGQMDVKARRFSVPESERAPHFGLALQGAVEALADEDALVRVRAARDLERLAAWSDRCLPVLARALRDEDDEVREIAAMALAARGEDGVPHLSEVLASKDPEHGAVALAALRHLGPAAHDAVPALIDLCGNEGSMLRMDAIRALGAVGPAAAEAVPVLEGIAAGEAAGLGAEAVRALRRIRAHGQAPGSPANGNR
ncbi:MAG: HEAT repeat domain-containing protein [Planctomycetota bacterium]